MLKAEDGSCCLFYIWLDIHFVSTLASLNSLQSIEILPN